MENSTPPPGNAKEQINSLPPSVPPPVDTTAHGDAMKQQQQQQYQQTYQPHHQRRQITIQGPPPPAAPRPQLQAPENANKGGSHRRTMSDDLNSASAVAYSGMDPNVVNAHAYGYGYGYGHPYGQMPPMQPMPPVQSMQPMQSMQPVQQAYGLPQYPTPTAAYAPSPPAPRTRSWSESQPNIPPYAYPQQQQQAQQYPPSPRTYAGGVPGMQDPAASALPPNGIPSGNGLPFQQSNNQAESSRKRKNGHRRSNSYSGGSVPNYGVVGGMPPPPPVGMPPPIPKGTRTGEFSPMNEFRKLAGARQPPSPRPSPRQTLSPSVSASPAARRNLPPPSPVRQSSLRAIGSFPKNEDARVSFSPGTPLNGYDANGAAAPGYGGFYGLGDYGADGASPGVGVGMPSAPEMGGEAVFLAQKGKHSRKSPSSRRQHMRQQSAQLFMEDVKGVEQIPSCRDISFLLLFLFHLLGIVYLGNQYGHEALEYHDDTDSDASVTIVYRNVIYVSCVSGLFAVCVSALSLLVMTFVARKIVQIALFLTITLSFAWGTIGIGLSPRKVVPATGIIALALSVAYAFIVWDRIPFAAANLNAGLSGIRANPGAVLIAFFFQALALGWSVYYTYVCIGVYDAIEAGDLDLTQGWRITMYSCLAISYYWTYNVFLNIVQVTVAGVIGSWWYTEEGDVSHRGVDLNSAFFRSSFYALGSICFGSLFVGPCRLLRQLTIFFRPSSEEASLLCLHQCFRFIQTCITSCVDGLTDKFNPWAFTYVGLYGYGLIDAGSHANELFAKRGWTMIVSDDLVPNVLLLATLVVGGFTGCFAHIIVNVKSLFLLPDNESLAVPFMAGLAVGLVVTGVLFGIISSSVSTVIVCFASNPVDFETNHPKLSQEMRNAWREVWPGCMDVVDMRVAVATFMDSTRSMPEQRAFFPSGEQQPLIS